MLGQMVYEEMTAARLPQKAQSAWDEAFSDLVGAEYKPLLYYAHQQVHGTNHFFIAEQTLMTYPVIKRVVKVVINANGEDCAVEVEEI